jgi:GntP family gluconate:H+ symporter
MVFFWLLLVVGLIVICTVRFKLHAFLSLMMACMVMGFLAELDTSTIIQSIGSGFGSTLQSIGIVIAAGTIIGEYLHRSGGAIVLADKILKWVGEKRAPISLSITGFIVSIPVFCDSGFIVLSSLKKALAKRAGIPMIVLSVALATGLYTTHVFVPPTPGPLAAAATLGADIGLVLLLGLLVSVPVMLAGLFYAKSLKTDKYVILDMEELPEVASVDRPSFVVAILPIFLPIVLIALKTIAEYPTNPFGTGAIVQIFGFIGNPIVALLLGVAGSFFMVRTGKNKIQNEWIEDALKKAGVIILITGAGGAFGAVLRQTEISVLAESFTQLSSMGIFIPFLVAAFLKTAQGSSTVAIITAAAILVPLTGSLGFDTDIGKALVVLAIGAGAMTVSHVNDSYFWVVAKFSGMDTSTALRVHTVSTLILGFTGIFVIQLLAWVLM